MAIQNIALSAYRTAQSAGSAAKQETGSTMLKKGKATDRSFASSVQDSLKTVNDLQSKKSNMIEAFTAGESENVHELMISLQKAGIAMSMTSAIRNKVLESYKELMRMPF